MASKRHFSYSSKKNSELQFGKPNAFLWGLFIIFLMVITICSWLFSIFLFTQPEYPLCYKILTRINKINKLKNFNSASVPKGKFMSAEELYNFFYEEDEEKNKIRNKLMLRNYLKNYNSGDLNPIYIKGQFRIKQIRKLTPKDFVRSGIVIRVQSIQFSEVIIEYILPGRDLELISFEINDIIKINGKPEYLAVINSVSEEKYQICLSVISLVYHNQSDWNGKSIAISSPGYVNINGKLPITDNKIGRITN